MSEITHGNEVKIPRGWKPPPTPLQRAHGLAEKLLVMMEAQLQKAGLDPEEDYERLFGPRGMLASLPKLIQLLEVIDGAAPTEAPQTLSADDRRLLEEWLAQ